VAAVSAFLRALPHDCEALILVPSPAAGLWLMAEVLEPKTARFAWQRRTLDNLASELALPALARAGLTPLAALGIEALCARTVDELNERGELGRFAPLGDKPGFIRALASSLRELRLSGATAAQLAPHDPDLARCFERYRRNLDAAGVADWAGVLEAATASARAPASAQRVLVACDVSIAYAAQADLVQALVSSASVACVSVAHGDNASRQAWEAALGPTARREELAPPGDHALARLQRQLFAPPSAASEVALESERVCFVASPGESREAVEVARAVLAAAESGVRFDRMAVLVRAVEDYRTVLEDALARARIPAHFADGVRRPAPEGRAFLALLACAEAGLSARHFAEYLSIGVFPRAQVEGVNGGTDTLAAGATSAQDDPGARQTGPGRAETLPPSSAADITSAPAPADTTTSTADSTAGITAAPAPADTTTRTVDTTACITSAPAPADTTLPPSAAESPSPRQWERMLVDAAVVGGRQRWTRRLRGLAHAFRDELALLEADDGRRELLERRCRSLGELERFADPILDALASLPPAADWTSWRESLERVAQLALQDPSGVCETLAELAPLGPWKTSGAVSLRAVTRLLSPRLQGLIVRSRGHGAGKVFVGSIDEARGRSFERVFVVGLAEKLFPPRIDADPLLPDPVRQALGGLPDLAARVAQERLALHLAVGAASERLQLSFPRFDAEQGRPRVPSFYGLEVLQAIHARLPAFDELTRRADPGAAARMGWPAPAEPAQAIDDAEYDLAMLEQLRKPGAAQPGAARYLLQENAHLARALRFRARRWELPRFGPADGLVLNSAQNPTEPGTAALLAPHLLSARAYSATSLAQFAACPYKFYLQAIMRLAEAEGFEDVAELDARQRGLLLHLAQSRVIEALLAAGMLPPPSDAEPAARRILRASFEQLIDEAREQYAPAIARVFDDALRGLHADLEGWLTRLLRDPDWLPLHSELKIAGAGNEPLPIESGLLLRGAIDLVEQRRESAGQRPVLRATDFKTGTNLPGRNILIGGGRVLQPLLYALALERLFPQAAVEGGRLYFCTRHGRYESRNVPLNERTRQLAAQLTAAIGAALERGFLPAAPERGACETCAYQAVCGPYEEERVGRVKQRDADRLHGLHMLRRQP
jgi:ATP-dependent helicase/nuclease subunit B